ncbi:putative ATP-dependent RNA helicase [uncultured archaeon]|nr:putative ATP-dependent RNA helicase [uncultured archaeon]
MKKFEELGLSQELLTIIREAGFETPSEIQEKTIPLAIAGKDIIGAAATGSGKTLAFASSMIENLRPDKTTQALILTPTRELAEQVASSISYFSRNRKLKVLSVYGGVSIETQIRKIPGADIIVGTPGRILDHLERRTLRLNKIKFLVLDEVDRMFDMGFLRDVEKILSQCSKERQTMLFSATVSADMGHLARRHTRDAVEVSVKSYIDHSKLKQVYYDVDNDEKFSLLVHLLEKENGNLVMVFCGTRHKVDFVAKNLEKQGINAQAIHGGLTQNKRTSVLGDFQGQGVGVLVCTDVAARGLDIKEVSHVYNYDLPPTSTEYIHRIGRTARAGREGKVINLLSNRDYDNFNNILRDEHLHIAQEPKPEFKKIYVEMTRSFGDRGRGFGGGRGQPRRSSGGNRPQRRFGGGARESGRRFDNDESPRNRHDHGPRTGPRKERTNRFSSRTNSQQGRKRSNFNSRSRRGNW